MLRLAVPQGPAGLAVFTLRSAHVMWDPFARIVWNSGYISSRGGVP